MSYRLRFLFAPIALLFCCLPSCYAQREDSLRITTPPLFPKLTAPIQAKEPDGKMRFGRLGLDGLEFSKPPEEKFEEKKDSIPLNLSVEQYMQYFQKDFLKWEKKKFGGHFDINEFVQVKGHDGSKDSPYAPKGNKGLVTAPYPIAPAFANQPISGIGISWAPTKGDIWFKKNFGIDVTSYGRYVLVDTMGLLAPRKKQMLHLVDSLLIDKAATETQEEDNLKRRIKQIKKAIREQARRELTD